jgi:hypothetical protein
MNTFAPKLQFVVLACLLTTWSSSFAQVQSTELPSLVAPRLVWPSTQISVCWENIGTTYDAEVQCVREVLTFTEN